MASSRMSQATDASHSGIVRRMGGLNSLKKSAPECETNGSGNAEDTTLWFALRLTILRFSSSRERDLKKTKTDSESAAGQQPVIFS